MNNINLNELTLDNIGLWPAPVNYLISLVLCIFIIALGYWVLIKSNTEQYDSLVSQEESLKHEFETKQNLAANLHDYQIQLQIIEAKFGKLLQELPAQNEMPGLLEDISKTGLSAGLTFELFAPQKEIEHEFYIELPIDIIVVGNYYQLATFLSRVGQLSRIVTLHDFEITPMDKVAAGNTQPNTSTNPITKNLDLLGMKITAKIYRYKNP